MEESNVTGKAFEDLYEMYIAIKIEIKCQHENGDRSKQLYFENILKCIDDKLNNAEKDSEAYMKLNGLKASLFYEHAKILIATQDRNENLCIQLLKEALLLIEAYKLNPQITYLYFRILNLLSYTLSKYNEIDEALKILEDVEVIYQNMNDSYKSNILVYNTDEFFQNVHVHKGNSELKFEKLVTNNFQIQGWIYNKMNLSKKFLKYHHIVLNRQLEMQDGNAVAWFYKCARLGVYFYSNQKFIDGKHHLAAAGTVLKEYELELLKHRNEPYFISEWNNLKKYYADLGKYWSKYGLFLFNASRHLAVSKVNSDLTMNDILINSFQDSSSSARDWYNIKKNSRFFEAPKKQSTHLSDADKHRAKQCYKNLVGELNEQKQMESVTDISFATEKSTKSNLVNNIKQEIDKLNKETIDKDSDSSEALTAELTEVTKMIIEALDDRQKEVETENKSAAIGDSKEDPVDDQKENDTADTKKPEEIDDKIKHTIGDQNDNDTDKTNTDSKSSESSNQKDTTESMKNVEDKEENNSKTSNFSDMHSTSSKKEDELDYEFKFPSLDLSQFAKIPATLIDSLGQARDFFLFIQEWIKRAKAYYTIQENSNEYVQLILDLNELYYYLSTYEIDIENQYDVQRRRVEILETLCTVLKEIRPQEYLFLSVELLQELTQSQIELLMLNIRRLANVRSSGGILLKDICQDHNDAARKVEALSEIQRRLGRRETKLSLIDMQLFG